MISKNAGGFRMERTEKYISDIELLFQEWKNKAPSDDINPQ